MTLDQVTRISNDPYFRGNNGEGQDYFDQASDILKRKYELQNKQMEKMMEKRNFDYEVQENEMIEKEHEEKNDYFKVSLYFVGIAPRKRKVDRNFFELGKVNHCNREKITPEQLEALKENAKVYLRKCKDIRSAEIKFSRWFDSGGNCESMIIFDPKNFSIQLLKGGLPCQE